MKRCLIAYLATVYLLWVTLPLVFGVLWGVDVGYEDVAVFPIPDIRPKVPGIVWWLLSPITFLPTLKLALLALVIDRSAIITPIVSPCLKGDWDTFPVSYAVTGWVLALALSLFVAVTIVFRQRPSGFWGKPRFLWIFLGLCCVSSFAAFVFCKGEGPYGVNLEAEREVVKLLEKGGMAPGEEKHGYRFVTDRLAVPLRYGRGNRARTFCRMPMQSYPDKNRVDDFIILKDTGGKTEPLPEVVPSKFHKYNDYNFDYLHEHGWEWRFCHYEPM
ncbi:MAG: hypothetical protein J6333_07255 [Planctomycetes bacterium]|nr:hypothetical protein [Planctomycetota bacterium]